MAKSKTQYNVQLIGVVVLFLLSGAAGLIYQIIRERLLETHRTPIKMQVARPETC